MGSKGTFVETAVCIMQEGKYLQRDKIVEQVSTCYYFKYGVDNAKLKFDHFSPSFYKLFLVSNSIVLDTPLKLAMK